MILRHSLTGKVTANLVLVLVSHAVDHFAINLNDHKIEGFSMSDGYLASMGTKHTKPLNDAGNTWQNNDESGAFLFTELSPELVTLILLYVPDDDLVKNCQLVCKTWRQLIDSYGFWKRKALMKGYHYPKYLALADFSAKTSRLIALQNPFKRNLIVNPYGKESFNGWSKPKHSGGSTNFDEDPMLNSHWHRHSMESSFAIEDPPAGADSLDTVDELRDTATSCFATTYFMGDKSQIIDLNKLGCSEEIMQFLKPSIYICDWYAARFDCGSYYSLSAVLLDKDKKQIDRFDFQHQEPQWTGSKWSKVEHTFTDTAEVRFVMFTHAGKDSQFWAGNYGSKMTGSTIKLLCE